MHNLLPILYIKKQCYQSNGEVRHIYRPPNEIFLCFLIGNIQHKQNLSFSIESKLEKKKIANGSYKHIFFRDCAPSFVH